MGAQSWVRRVSSAVGAMAVGVGLVLVAPTAATAATTNYTLDCSDVSALGYSSQTFYVVPGDTVTFSLTGFDTVYDYDASADIASLDPSGDSYEVSSGQSLSFYNNVAPCADYMDVYVTDAVAETAPSGQRLFTQTITIPEGTTNELALTDNDPDLGNSEHLLNGLDTCRLSTEIHGLHVYSTLDVTVLKSGTYTFRGLITDPLGYYVGLNPYDPIGDSFLAVYSDFNPAAPDSGVVGCNDDLNDLGDENDAEFTSENVIIEGHEPRFEAELAPGHYTLVLMTWEDLSADNFANGYGPWQDADFTVGAKSNTFELWGPEGGLALGHVAFASLAATGSPLVDAGVGAGIGGTLAVGGLLVLVLARRRRAARA